MRARLGANITPQAREQRSSPPAETRTESRAQMPSTSPAAPARAASNRVSRRRTDNCIRFRGIPSSLRCIPMSYSRLSFLERMKLEPA